jgi:hypothetical protein
MHFSHVSQFAIQIHVLTVTHQDVSPRQCVEHLITKTLKKRPKVWGQISPRSTRRQEGLAKGLGPIISQGHPFVGQGRNVWQNGST